VLNFATSLIETAPSPATSGTSLTVRSGQGARFVAGQATIYPASGVIDPTTSEVVTITPSGDTLALMRAREGTAARWIQAGDVIIQGLTAGMWIALTAATPAAIAATQTQGFTAEAGYTYPCDAAGGTVPATLPAGSAGDVIRFVNIGATGTATVTHGGNTASLTRQWDRLTVQCLSAGVWIEI